MLKLIRKVMTGFGSAPYQASGHGVTDEPVGQASLAVPSGEGERLTTRAASVTVPVGSAAIQRERLWSTDQVSLWATTLARRWFVPAARVSIFVIYFWFGLLKMINLSPATPLAAALVNHTIGLQYFSLSFKALAFYECALGILFLIPALTKISVVLLAIHMAIVSSPLILVAENAWTHPLVPTFEGQYIIKDLALIALAIGILAHTSRPRAPTRTDS